MEEEAEKMTALKRAYADIILNTQKESAARVLAAERRALGFQQSLFTVKEEAVATMLRLKALMEDKIKVAEKASLCQSKKIEELELQLGEAEDTIVDLREDLKRVREELIMMKNGSVQPLTEEGNLNDTNMVVCNNIGKETSTGDLNEPENMSIISNNMATLSQKTEDSNHCCLQISEKAEEASAEVGFPGNNADLASIIWRSKVPDLYRKGYTQRIHALEHNLNSKGPFGESNGLQSFSKSEPISCTSEKLKIPCKTDSSMSDKRTKVKDFSPRIQRMIYKQSNVFSDGIFSDKSCCSGSSKFAVHEKWNEIEVRKGNPAPFIQLAAEIGETSEDKRSLADISTEREAMTSSLMAENMGINHCTERMNRRIFQKQNQSVCEDVSLQNSLQNTEDVKIPFLSKISSVSIQEDSEDRTEVDVVSMPEAENIAENSDNSDTVKPDIKDIANGAAQTGTDKFLKYTFQRKRKKGSSPIKNEITFPEKKPTLKSKSVDKQKSVPVPSKSSVVTDLPRNNRRLVQVARQLISLSEKRW